MKTACEFLKDDPLSLNDASSVGSSISAGSLSTINLSPERSRSVSFSSANKFGKPISAPPHHVNSARFSLNHRKSQSADLYGLVDLTMSGSNSNSSIHPSPLEQEVLDVDLEHDHYSASSANSSNSNSRRNSAILRPHIVLPNPRHGENRKSLDIPNDWLLPNYATSTNTNTNTTTYPASASAAATTTASTMTATNNTNYYNNRYKLIPSRNLGLSKPMVTTTFPSISNSTPLPIDLLSSSSTDTSPVTSSSSQHIIDTTPRLGRSLSTSTVVKKKLAQPPKVINIRDRISFDGIRRPASICIDTRSLHSIEDGAEDSEELMGDFLRGLSKIDGNVVGERTGSIKSFRQF